MPPALFDMKTNPRIKTIAAKQNAVPAEKINSLPFLPEEFVLMNATMHPRIMVAKAPVEIRDNCVRMEFNARG